MSERREAQRLAAARERTLAAVSLAAGCGAGTGVRAWARAPAGAGAGVTGVGPAGVADDHGLRGAVLSVTQMSSPRAATCQALKPAGSAIERCAPSGAIRSSRRVLGGDVERAVAAGRPCRTGSRRPEATTVGAGAVALGRVDPGDLAGVEQRHVELAVAADLDAVGAATRSGRRRSPPPTGSSPGSHRPARDGVAVEVRDEDLAAGDGQVEGPARRCSWPWRQRAIGVEAAEVVGGAAGCRRSGRVKTMRPTTASPSRPGRS